jgi:hypothetical protein
MEIKFFIAKLCKIYMYDFLHIKCHYFGEMHPNKILIKILYNLGYLIPFGPNRSSVIIGTQPSVLKTGRFYFICRTIILIVYRQGMHRWSIGIFYPILVRLGPERFTSEGGLTDAVSCTRF